MSKGSWKLLTADPSVITNSQEMDGDAGSGQKSNWVCAPCAHVGGLKHHLAHDTYSNAAPSPIPTLAHSCNKASSTPQTVKHQNRTPHDHAPVGNCMVCAVRNGEVGLYSTVNYEYSVL